jgi:hypothetical protein
MFQKDEDEDGYMLSADVNLSNIVQVQTQQEESAEHDGIYVTMGPT